MNRRKFIRNTLSSALGMGMFPGSAMAAINSSSASGVNSGSSDYKALVCIMLSGGNDSINTIVPTNNELYLRYSDIRQHLSISQNSLLSLGNSSYGLHPSMPEIQSLYNNGKCAVMANVGNLIKPTNIQEYTNGINIPSNIGSHSSQTTMWQKNHSGELSQGWAGILADTFKSQNQYDYLSNISITGKNEFLVGNKSSYYVVTPSGPQKLKLNTSSDLYNSILYKNHAHILERAYSTIQIRSNDTYDLLNSNLNGVIPMETVFPSNNGLASNLEMVAKLIQVRSNLGMNKQVFFLSGAHGFDTHANQLGTHTSNLAAVSEALSAFYNATVELGIENQVTAFTMSDFGRSIKINSNNGTDHGWGGHHFMIGGAVNGGQIYGEMPDITIDGPNDNGRGSLIPTTATDQYAATLAQWFGTDGVSLDEIFPNLSNFATSNLGFMG